MQPEKKIVLNLVLFMAGAYGVYYLISNAKRKQEKS
jgi:hypothetical protein